MKENIYRIQYSILHWNYEWISESAEGYYSAFTEDEAIAKCVIPLLKQHRAVDIKKITIIEVK